MICSISGEVATEPVVSIKSGYVFEKRLIEKFIAANGKCPISGVEMTVDDLVPLKAAPSADTAIVKPRMPQNTSIPTMIQQFQSEWDAAALEIFTLKKELKTAKEELAHALYTHDASCRVIARLVKERDELRAMLNAGPVTSGSQGVAKMEVDEISPAGKGSKRPRLEEQPSDEINPSEDTKNVITQTQQNLTKQRKANKAPPLENDQVAAYHAGGRGSLGKKGVSGCTVSALAEGRIAIGCNNGSLVMYKEEKDSLSEQWRVAVAKRNVKSIAAGKDSLLVCAEDGDEDVVALYDSVSGERKTVYDGKNRLCSVLMHPSEKFFFEARVDGTWVLRSVEDGTVLAQKKLADSVFSCAGVHPDGGLLATAVGGHVKVWDVKAGGIVASLDASDGESDKIVTNMAFSENGYIFASGCNGGKVKIWDFRKIVCVGTIENESPISALTFDHTGHILAAGNGSAISLLNGTRTFEAVKTLQSAAKSPATVSGLSFAPDSSRLFGVSSRSSIVDVFMP